MLALVPIIPSLMNGVHSLAASGMVAGLTIAEGGAVAVTSWAALAGVLWPIAAAIAAIVGVVLLYNEAQKKTSEAKLKRLEEAYEDIKASTKEAQQAAEDLKNTIESYDSAVETLNNCSKGTEEWKEALQGVNDVLQDIIANNDLSREQIDTLRTGSQEEIKSLLNDLQSQADMRAEVAQWAEQ